MSFTAPRRMLHPSERPGRRTRAAGWRGWAARRASAREHPAARLLLVCCLALSAAAHDLIDPASSLAGIEAELRASPEDPELHAHRAEALLALGRVAEAHATMDSLVVARPRDGRMPALRARVYGALRQYDRAEADLSEALRLSAGTPRFDSADVLLRRARARRALGQLEQARADYDAALPFVDGAGPFLERGAVLEQLGALDEAAANYVVGYARCGQRELLGARVELALTRSRPDTALALLAAIPTRFRAPWRLLEARAHDLAGRPEQARQAREAALREAEDAAKTSVSPLVPITLARAQAALGRKDEAARTIAAVRASYPELVEAQDAEWEIIHQRARPKPSARWLPRGAPAGPPLLAVLLVLALTRAARRKLLRARTALALAALFLAAGAAGGWFLQRLQRTPSELAAHVTFERLHANVYEAFKARDEDTLYDILARSVAEGPLLDRLYKEMFQVLEASRRGELFVDIERVEIVDLALESSSPDALALDCTWLVGGRVTHQQHTHYRLNQYRAGYVLERQPDDDWKLATVEVMQQVRLEAGESADAFGLQTGEDYEPGS